MIQISKINHFFSPSQNVSLSDLSPSDKSKIKTIWGVLPSGASLSLWRPDLPFPTLRTLKANHSYWIQSNEVGFEPYSLDIGVGQHPQNEYISKIFTFFTYAGDQSFALADLSQDVKPKIHRIYRPNNSGNGIWFWDPDFDSGTPFFSSFAKGQTYIIQSIKEDFSPYYLGLPEDEDYSGLFFVDEAMLPDIGLVPQA